MRLSTSRRQRPRHAGEVCCEPAADALAPPRRVSAPISNRIVDRAEVELGGEISMVRGTGRLEVNGTFMAHKGGKNRSPVSASVNEPRTKQRIANILNGYLPFFKSVGRRFEPDGAHSTFVLVRGLGSAFMPPEPSRKKRQMAHFCATS
jgi:hypothetical protein